MFIYAILEPPLYLPSIRYIILGVTLKNRINVKITQYLFAWWRQVVLNQSENHENQTKTLIQNELSHVSFE